MLEVAVLCASTSPSAAHCGGAGQPGAAGLSSLLVREGLEVPPPPLDAVGLRCLGAQGQLGYLMNLDKGPENTLKASLSLEAGALKHSQDISTFFDVQTLHTTTANQIAIVWHLVMSAMDSLERHVGLQLCVDSYKCYIIQI